MVQITVVADNIAKDKQNKLEDVFFKGLITKKQLLELLPDDLILTELTVDTSEIYERMCIENGKINLTQIANRSNDEPT